MSLSFIQNYNLKRTSIKKIMIIQSLKLKLVGKQHLFDV